MSATRVLALLATAVLVVAGCTSSGAGSTPNGGGASSAAGPIVAAASSPTFGMVLTGPNGMTLYTHAGDSATASTCTGGCATAWPPLATTGQPTAGAGVTGQLGTLTRGDGTTQVTYGGMPLYYWQGDKKAGDVTGDGVDGFAVATVGGAGTQPIASPAAPRTTHPAEEPHLLTGARRPILRAPGRARDFGSARLSRRPAARAPAASRPARPGSVARAGSPTG